MQGGHRVGITGNVVMKDEKVININYIYSLNFRIAKQIIGCSNKILKYIIDQEENNIYSTLIESPPGVGVGVLGSQPTNTRAAHANNAKNTFFFIT